MSISAFGYTYIVIYIYLKSLDIVKDGAFIIFFMLDSPVISIHFCIYTYLTITP